MGTPRPAGGVGQNTATLYAQSAPGINVEWPIRDSYVVLQGPHGGATYTVKVSQNQFGCGKTITVRLYGDGVKLGDPAQAMTVDSNAGTDRTYALQIPAEPREITRRYWLTWSSTCGTGDMDSAYRVVSVRLAKPGPATFGIPPALSSSSDDWFTGPFLASWWANPTFPVKPRL